MKKNMMASALAVGVISAGCIIIPMVLHEPAEIESDGSMSACSISDCEEPVIIINQGLGMGLDKEDGSLYAMDELVAERGTGLFVKAAPEWEEEAADSVMTVRGNGQEWNFPAEGYDESSWLIDYTGSGQREWQAGRYLITVRLGDYEYEREVCFRNMKNIRILAVPITACYSGKKEELDELEDSLDDFTRKVYPLGREDLEWTLYDAGALVLENENYDLDTSGGRYRIWRILSKMRGDDYDLVVGFVPKNMLPGRGAEKRTLTGFTFGEAASVISLEDTSPEVTVAHEIGHCYNLGDEYENGTFCLNYNMAPYGMKGRNANDLSETVSGNCPYIRGGQGNEEQGTGTIVYKEQYAYDIMTDELIPREMTSLMGLSGYSAKEYWSTTDIWDTMYHALAE